MNKSYALYFHISSFYAAQMFFFPIYWMGNFIKHGAHASLITWAIDVPLMELGSPDKLMIKIFDLQLI